METFESYYNTGECKRAEVVLVDEVAYGQRRLCEGIAAMLKRCVQYMPIVVAINRFQMVGESTMNLIKYLIENPIVDLGIFMGVSESGKCPEYNKENLEKIKNLLVERNCVYNMGTTGRFFKAIEEPTLEKYRDIGGVYRKISNIIEFSRALEIIAKIEDSTNPYNRFGCAYLRGICYMYQDRFADAAEQVEIAQKLGDDLEDDFFQFLAKFLEVEIRMSGWYKLLFMVSDIEIEDMILRKLEEYEFYNHLAHVYIYAFDNNPDTVKKVHDNNEEPGFCRKGVELAYKIGNYHLVYCAYQKNIMIAFANGMNDIALYFSVNTYLSLGENDTVLKGRALSGVGYNLSVMGYYDKAVMFFDRAVKLFYDFKEGAEVKYNAGINYFCNEKFDEADNAFSFSLKTVQILSLNSLRVCNLSKLYALLAIANFAQGQIFRGECYLTNCQLFLNYILEKNGVYHGMESFHAYAKCDDDMFLYYYAQGYHDQIIGSYDKALDNYNKADEYLLKAEGKEFYCKEHFRRRKNEVYVILGKQNEALQGKELLRQYMQKRHQLRNKVIDDLIDSINVDNDTEPVLEAKLEYMIVQAGIEESYNRTKKHMEYFAGWQKLMDEHFDTEEEFNLFL